MNKVASYKEMIYKHASKTQEMLENMTDEERSGLGVGVGVGASVLLPTLASAGLLALSGAKKGRGVDAKKAQQYVDSMKPHPKNIDLVNLGKERIDQLKSSVGSKSWLSPFDLRAGAQVNYGANDPAFLAHELGHISGRGSMTSTPERTSAMIGSRGLASILGLPAAGSAGYMGMEAASKEDGKAKDPKEKVASTSAGFSGEQADLAGKGLAAGYFGLNTPTLYEEARASLRGLKHIKKIDGTGQMLRSMPALGAAYGTYLGAAAAPAVGFVAAKKLSEKMNQPEKTASIKEMIYKHASDRMGEGVGTGLSIIPSLKASIGAGTVVGLGTGSKLKGAGAGLAAAGLGIGAGNQAGRFVDRRRKKSIKT